MAWSRSKIRRPADTELYQGSMGIYVFNRQVLIDVLANDHDDFGKRIIPASLQKYKVFAYIFQEYWENIGTGTGVFRSQPGSDRSGAGSANTPSATTAKLSSGPL